jgi:hypothetical protein
LLAAQGWTLLQLNGNKCTAVAPRNFILLPYQVIIVSFFFSLLLLLFFIIPFILFLLRHLL